MRTFVEEQPNVASIWDRVPSTIAVARKIGRDKSAVWRALPNAGVVMREIVTSGSLDRARELTREGLDHSSERRTISQATEAVGGLFQT